MNVIKQYLNEFNVGIKTMFKEFFNKDTNKKQRANMWTFSRLVSAFIIPILTTIGVLINSTPVLIAAFTTAGFGAITDFIDGRSARKHNSSSEFGALLDAASDKAYTTLLGLGLSLLNPMFILNIIGEIAITLTNLIYKINYEGLEMKSSKIGKIKQWPLSTTFILGIISILLPKLTALTNGMIIATFIAQLATINSYVSSNNQQIKELAMKNKTIDNEMVNTSNKELDLKLEKEINNSIKKIENNLITTPEVFKPKTRIRKRKQ